MVLTVLVIDIDNKNKIAFTIYKIFKNVADTQVLAWALVVVRVGVAP